MARKQVPGNRPRLSIWRQELLAGLFLLLVPFLMFWRVTLAGKVLIPFDILYSYEPWRYFADQMGVGTPHNGLLADLLLENYAWKHFIVECLGRRILPLWNPYLFAGVPFLAAGQHSALYPFSLLYYVLPIARAYGYFTALQLGLAGLFMYAYLRAIGVRPIGAILGGISYSLCGFMLVSVVFPMALAVGAWLPLVLAAIELAVKKVEASSGNPLPYLMLGAMALGMQFLAGHIEFSYYILMLAASYSLMRLVFLWQETRSAQRLVSTALGLVVMALVGVGLGAVQLIPLAELVRENFRAGSASLSQVLGWAYPKRQIITFLIPDFFGNPSHHSYFDVFSWKTTPVATDYFGRSIGSTFWGIKNYVEAGAYMGVLPPVLALIALRRRDRYVAFWAALAVLSLLLAFGTPFYGLLYYLVPGYKQLHTPFRWVFPFSFSIAALAGIGAQKLLERKPGERGYGLWLEILAWIGSSVILLGLVGSKLFPRPFLDLMDQLAVNSAAQNAFANAKAFYSYQFRNFFFFALMLGGAGLVFSLSRRATRLSMGKLSILLWPPVAIALIIFDFGFLLGGFNPASDARLGTFTPPAVEFLQGDKSLYRIASLDRTDRDEKLFNPNVGMFLGIADIRGYDSIIPRRYTKYMGLIEPQGQLIYNRIAPLYNPASLDSPLLDLLNVKYLLTTRSVDNPSYRLVYDGELKVFLRENYLPRAFLVEKARVIAEEDELLAALRTLDPRQEVLLEEKIKGTSPEYPGPLPEKISVQILAYSPNEVIVAVEAPRRAFLVLGDSYFTGWRAYLSREGMAEEEVKLYRANYNFRSVEVPPGRWIVRFKYTPMSFKLGLFASFFSLVILALVGIVWFWNRVYREGEGTAQRVTKNSLAPITLALLNKVIDMAFAMLMLRILKPEGAGKFGFAIVFIGYFEILTSFGLGTLLTREVAKDRSQGNSYLGSTVVLRFFLWIASLPLMGLALALYWKLAGLDADTAAAIGLFAIGLIPGNIANALSALLNAHEKMEYPALVSTATTLVRVGLGTLVLLEGWGFVGLAGVSIIGNLFTLALLAWFSRRVIGELRPTYRPQANRGMLATSYPLMLNHLLATFFLRSDVLLLKPLAGDTQVGWYTAAYKFLDGLNVVPAYFTMALFPLVSRYAQEAKESLRRAYLISIRLLFLLSLPIAVGTTIVAPQLIALLGGADYLRESTLALRLLIWSVPLGFINSLTQYVLIALDEQRYISKSFALAVAFRILFNLLLIPYWGYRACAALTIASEAVLLIPFLWRLRSHIGSLPLFSLGWRPALAAIVMGMVLWPIRGENFVLLTLVAIIIYAPAIILLGGWSPEEKALLRRLMPAHLTRFLLREAAP